MKEARRVACPVLVGRAGEVDFVRSAVDAAAETGSVIAVLGEAGIGKSRVSKEAILYARAAGAVVLTASCSQPSQSAYAPVVSALRVYMQGVNSAEIGRVFGGAAGVAVSLLPEVASRSYLNIPPANVAAEHLFAALWHVVRRVGDGSSVLLVVEDAHRADRETIDLLLYLAREAPDLRLCLVVTARPETLHAGHALVPMLSKMRRLPWFGEVSLLPLGRDGVDEMLTALLDTPHDASLVDAMFERSGGIPYFVEELCARLEVASPLTLPDAMVGRLQALAGDDVRILQLAAVAGERIDRGLLAAAAETDIERVDSLVESAVREGVFVEVFEEGAPRQVFRHALVREALVAELKPADRREAHRRVATALRSRRSDTAADALALSRHYEEAGEPAEALRFTLEAARDASDDVAASVTLDHFERALRLAAKVGADELPILLSGAAALTDTPGTTVADGMRYAQQARRLARDRGAVVEESRALALVARYTRREGHVDDAARVCEDAIRLVHGHDDSAEADSLALLIGWFASDGGHQETAALIAKGRALATASGNLTALADVERAAGLCAERPDDADEGFTRSIRAARTAGDVEREVATLSMACMVALRYGRIRRAREASEHALALVANSNGRAFEISMRLAFVQALAGELDGALSRVAAMDGGQLQGRTLQTRSYALAALAEVYLRTGDTGHALDVADDALRLTEDTGNGVELSLAVHARIHLSLADDEARDTIEPFLDGHWEPEWLLSPDVVMYLARRGDLDALRRFEERVRASTVSRGPGTQASRDFCSGLVALHSGDVQEAIERLEAAALAFAGLPMPARRVEALIALARAHAHRSERRRAVTALLEARHSANEMNALALKNAVAATLRDLGIRAPRSTNSRFERSGLSPTEGDVAALIATGLGNAEIADQLAVSRRTVANHVSNILAKLDLSNRGEVARWAMAHDLTSLARTPTDLQSAEQPRLSVLSVSDGGRQL